MGGGANGRRSKGRGKGNEKGGGKGQGKGRNEGKGRREGKIREERYDEPEEVPRERLFPTRITGRLMEWKGNFGWIKPTERIDHPDAKKRKGKVFVAQEDVEQDLASLNQLVSFFAYADGSGIGAMHVRPAKEGPAVTKSIQKAQPGSAKAAAGKAGGKGAKGSKGTSKGADKGTKAAKKPREPREQPDKSLREEVTPTAVEGTVKRTRGKFCFIKPDEPIDHPDAKKHRGMIFWHADDMTEGESEIPLFGAKVLFYVYSDGIGLGADRLQILEQGTEKKGKDEDADEDADEGKGKKVLKHKLKLKRNRGGKGKGEEKEKKKGKGKGKGKDKEKKEKGPSGPDLPRERISTEPVTGEVVVWKRKFGFIKPEEEVDHEESAKHGGKIYIHQNDVPEGVEMKVGLKVQFHIFQDASGLGAEECESV
mmetsp:Transcript_12282/g.25948  ORF Transcript_12282/g.25948 Transcript_12282/m.25948 type:complete len:424 (+) Transcript_12282:103-1374(+)